MEHIRDKRDTDMPQITVGEQLTEREIIILQRLFSGQSSSEVASTLQVSKRTVDFHLARAYAKMGVTNRYDAYKKAIELGIVGE